MNQDRLFAMEFAKVYPLYVQKAERKNRTKHEVDQIIRWLTGYDDAGLRRQIEQGASLATFFEEAPAMNPNSSLITGVVCGIRVEEIEDPLMQKIRYLDKLIDELARGKAMDKIMRWGEVDPDAWTPVTFEHYDHVEGPFYHGTKSELKVGEELIPGYGSNFQDGRVSNNIYFTSLVDTAAWGAELATALAGSEERGHIYIVEPLGPFEDDPNVTNKRFPGNPTRSYRTPAPLRVIGELEEWEGHSPEVLQGMLDHLAQLREQGLDVIED